MKDSCAVYDVCIVGAGVAGGVLAAYLGKLGVRVAVVEKSLVAQERIVGELLQPGGVMMLKEMELDFLLEGFDAQPVAGYGLFMNGDSFKISYPTEDKTLKGYGFRNHKFVEKIREHISSIPSVELFEGNVTALFEENGRVNCVSFTEKASGEKRDLRAHLTVVCDGMFSLFREGLSNGGKKVSSYFLGMILKDCNLPYSNHGHVVVANPSPCLLYPISSSETRILIDFPQEEAPRKSAELTDYLTNVICPQLPTSVHSSFMKAVEDGRFKVMPNHYIPAKPVFKPGVLLLGDSLNMRHPLTGGGMTVAFSDIKLFGELLIQSTAFSNESLKLTTEKLDEVVKCFYSRRHRQDATINILADALYGVMRNEDLKEACYSYLKRGGVYAEEPVSLLSAISRNQKLLLRHFFAVALYGVKNVMQTFPTPKRIRRSHKMIGDAVDIVSPLVLNEKPGRLTRYAFKASQAIF